MCRTLVLCVWLDLFPAVLAAAEDVNGDELSEAHYPRAASLLSVAFYGGGILGPYFLAVAMDRFGYEYLFYAAGMMTLLFSALPLSLMIGKKR